MSDSRRDPGSGPDNGRGRDGRRGPVRGGPGRRPPGSGSTGRPFRTLAFWALVVLHRKDIKEEFARVKNLENKSRSADAT